jgi:Kef-type K+ transport system membrane component KefB
VLGAHAAHLDPLLGALAGGLLYGGARRTTGRDASARSGLVGRLERVHVVFLPIFFAAAGLSAVRPAHPWRFVLLTLVLSLLAVVCRLVGVRAVARWVSLNPVEVGVAAWLTCARGATEIAMIKVGADLHLLAPTLVGPSIVMALVTTAVSGAVLGRLDTRALARRSSEPAQRAGARAAP